MNRSASQEVVAKVINVIQTGETILRKAGKLKSVLASHNAIAITWLAFFVMVVVKFLLPIIYWTLIGGILIVIAVTLYKAHLKNNYPVYLSENLIPESSAML